MAWGEMRKGRWTTRWWAKKASNVTRRRDDVTEVDFGHFPMRPDRAQARRRAEKLRQRLG